MRNRHYRRDLRSIPVGYREEIKDFIEQGKPPQNRLLLNLVTGNFSNLIDEIDPELGAVLHVLKSHAPDFAYGSKEAVARWEFMKGAATGRAATEGNGND